ncbi:hypothetical protein AB0K08_04925 [Citricoccus sp. NPDC055426]|uniref:hypothetical protein n=1 Tax=Citricoccus sp. NPDC055426 TaxID=3155536 RepID=UPI00342B2A28
MAFPGWREPTRLLEESAGPPTDEQLGLALKVGYRFTDESRVVLAAAIEAWLRPTIWQEQLYPATERQQAVLRELGHTGEVAELSRPVASAWIEHHLAARTAVALRKLRLRSGDIVDHEQRHVDPATGEVHVWSEAQTVSSIGRNGLVYFRGGNGRCGWPSKIRRSDAPPSE